MTHSSTDILILEFVANLRWVLSYACQHLDPILEVHYPRIHSDARILAMALTPSFAAVTSLGALPYGALEIARSGCTYLLVAEGLLGSCPPTMHPFLLNVTSAPQKGNTPNDAHSVDAGAAGLDEGNFAEERCEIQTRSLASLVSDTVLKSSCNSAAKSEAMLLLVRWLTKCEVLSLEEVLETLQMKGNREGSPGNERDAFRLQKDMAARLSRLVPFFLGAHTLITRSLLLQYVTAVVEVDDVVGHVRKLSPDTDISIMHGGSVQTVEDALMLWLRTVAHLVSAAEPLANDRALRLKRLWARLCKEEELYHAIQDGAVLCLTIYFYRPQMLPLQHVTLEPATNATDKEFLCGGITRNWAIVLRCAEVLGLSLGLTTDEVTHFGSTTLQLHLLRCVEELFTVLATHAEEEVRVSAELEDEALALHRLYHDRDASIPDDGDGLPNDCLEPSTLRSEYRSTPMSSIHRGDQRHVFPLSATDAVKRGVSDVRPPPQTTAEDSPAPPLRPMVSRRKVEQSSASVQGKPTSFISEAKLNVVDDVFLRQRAASLRSTADISQRLSDGEVVRLGGMRSTPVSSNDIGDAIDPGNGIHDGKSEPATCSRQPFHGLDVCSKGNVAAKQGSHQTVGGGATPTRAHSTLMTIGGRCRSSSDNPGSNALLRFQDRPHSLNTPNGTALNEASASKRSSPRTVDAAMNVGSLGFATPRRTVSLFGQGARFSTESSGSGPRLVGDSARPAARTPPDNTIRSHDYVGGGQLRRPQSSLARPPPVVQLRAELTGDAPAPESAVSPSGAVSRTGQGDTLCNVWSLSAPEARTARANTQEDGTGLFPTGTITSQSSSSACGTSTSNFHVHHPCNMALNLNIVQRPLLPARVPPGWSGQPARNDAVALQCLQLASNTVVDTADAAPVSFPAPIYSTSISVNSTFGGVSPLTPIRTSARSVVKDPTGGTTTTPVSSGSFDDEKWFLSASLRKERGQGRVDMLEQLRAIATKDIPAAAEVGDEESLMNALNRQHDLIEKVMATLHTRNGHVASKNTQHIFPENKKTEHTLLSGANRLSNAISSIHQPSEDFSGDPMLSVDRTTEIQKTAALLFKAKGWDVDGSSVLCATSSSAPNWPDFERVQRLSPSCSESVDSGCTKL